MNHNNISIIGIGGCGCNIVNETALGIIGDKPRMIAIDTDISSLHSKTEIETIQVGESRFQGLGSGGDTPKAKMAAQEDAPMLRQLLSDTALAIIVVGLGGGTGSTYTQVVLSIARELCIPTMVYAIQPFSIEGQEKIRAASSAFQNIRNLCDTYMLCNNDDIHNSQLDSVSSGVTLIDAMQSATRYLSAGITLLWKFVSMPGYINIGFADLISIIKKGKGSFNLAYGYATGASRLQMALYDLTEAEKCGINAIANRSKAALIGIIGGNDLMLNEISSTANTIKGILPQDASIHLGTIVEPMRTDTLEIITLIFYNWIDTLSEEIYLNNLDNNSNSHSTLLGHLTNNPKQSEFKQKSNYFSEVNATTYNGENLDIPTYLRKRIVINK